MQVLMIDQEQRELGVRAEKKRKQRKRNVRGKGRDDKEVMVLDKALFSLDKDFSMPHNGFT